MPTSTKPKKKLEPTEEHKAAMSVGRRESRIVKAYLEALSAQTPTRGRKPRPADERLADVVAKLADPSTSAIEKLSLRQEKVDIEAEMRAVETTTMIGVAEQEFVEVGANYARRKGITYGVWRQAGVPASVLKRAGINR